MTTQNKIKEAFEEMTGMPDAWTNPALMMAKNAFIQGWEAQTVISAAPELLEALKEYVAFDPVEVELNCLKRLAFAAIAKATGETE